MTFSLGYSPCPNDCFVFYALVHGKVAPELAWDIRLEDVETLNLLAREGTLAVSKISYSAYGHVMADYVMLRSGGALGRGVGPLLVSKGSLASLSGRRVAVPGGLTTANLLLKLSQDASLETLEMRYERIMPAVARGEVDAGLIIHESRFTYPDYGLSKHQDLGEWWQEETGLPLPLGGIVAKRSLSRETLARVDEAIRSSLRYAYAQPAETQAYVAAHAQEMDPEVTRRHIDLYVNHYTDDIGEDGERAVAELFRRARARGLMPPTDQELFV